MQVFSKNQYDDLCDADVNADRFESGGCDEDCAGAAEPHAVTAFLYSLRQLIKLLRFQPTLSPGSPVRPGGPGSPTAPSP